MSNHRNTEAEYVAAHPKDRALAVAILRLARIEALPPRNEAVRNASGHAKLALNEIANLAPILALNVEEVRSHYRRPA